MASVCTKYLLVKAIAVGLIFVLFACSDDLAEPAPSSVAPQTAQTAPTPAQPDTEQTPSSATTQTPRTASTPAQPDTEPAEPVKVAASLNLIEDWVENIGGDRVEATSLMPIGSDPHTFQPGPRAVAEIAEADLALIIGLRLEAHWLGELIKNAARDPSTVVELGDVIDPIEFVEIHDAHADDHDHEDADARHDHDHEDADADHDHEHEDGDADHDHEHENDDADHDHGDADADHDHDHEDGADDGHDHEHGPLDPHFWHDPLRVKKAVWDISARLSVLDPSGAETYRSNAEAYNARLDELHAWIVAQVARIPEERRLLVTSHDSMGYFADAYGFKVLGVILSTATEAEPSADDIARLSQKVEEYGVPAVFGETTISERLAATVASEAGATLVKLHSESLSAEGGGAETYIEMMRTNVTLIVEALE